MSAKLEQVMLYENENVVRRFLESWTVSYDEGLELFDDMKKWLWLCDYNNNHVSSDVRVHMAISQSIKLIDEMWHTFILFTADYHDFCDRYFGYYIHHRPAPQSVYNQQLASHAKDPEAHMRKLQEDAEKQYTLIYEQLGEETLVKWFNDYLVRYSDEILQMHWRWSFSPYDARAGSSLGINELAKA